MEDDFPYIDELGVNGSSDELLLQSEVGSPKVSMFTPARGGTATQRRKWGSRRRIKPFHFRVQNETLQPPKPTSERSLS